MGGSVISIFVSKNHPQPHQPTKEDLLPEVIFRKGSPKTEEASEMVVEILKRAGLGCDESAKEKISEECSLLAEIGYDGRIYPKIISIPEGEDPQRLIGIARGNSQRITRTLSADNLPQIRIAFFRTDDRSAVDPVLHYLNLSFSAHAQGANSSFYQPNAFEITKEAFEKERNFKLDTATPDDIWTWIAMDVIREIPVDSPIFVMAEGFMRLPTRFYGNYNKTSYDIYDIAGVQCGTIYKQGCDGANYPFVGFGGVVAFRKGT